MAGIALALTGGLVGVSQANATAPSAVASSVLSIEDPSLPTVDRARRVAERRVVHPVVREPATSVPGREGAVRAARQQAMREAAAMGPPTLRAPPLLLVA
ncbi:MAG: hypothetical protein ACRD29_06415 [Acidimicrobiales bacterium]